MKIFLGNDICEINRIQAAFDKFGKKFLEKTFTENEIKYCLSSKKNTASRLSVRFATKEAVSKALGVGIKRLGWSKGINWKDVESIRDINGALTIRLCGKAKELEQQLGITKWEVSVSHSHTDAISTVIGYKE
ncbi:MAG: holo-[acyl-carrier-protein] synthase [Candidatus Melainabacteria bacterium GWA2_34_9]|nr:MAG: holo-[acyl-carrier-protein] synthase [Candidatus Melainabacteria bacterium GWA2_34_9]